MVSPQNLEKERESLPKPLASQNSTLPDLRRTEWCGRRSSFESLQTRFRGLQKLCCPFSHRARITNGEHFTGVCENGGAVLRERLSVFCRQQRFWWLFLPANRCVHSTVQSDSTSLFSRSMARSYLQVLFAQYRPGWMHLLATANYPRAMCLKNCFVSASQLGLFKAIQRNAGCFLLSTKVVVLLLPANHCLLIIAQCGYLSQISRNLVLFMLLAEVSVPFLSNCCPTFSVKVGSTCTQQSGLPR